MYETIREAAEAWVNGFNAIPIGVVEKLNDIDECGVTEITPACLYDEVRIVFDEYAGENGEIVETNVDNVEGLYKIRLDNGETIKKFRDDIEVVSESDYLPMWGTMWSFGENIDAEWAYGEHLGSHLQEMADCGFRIYEQEDYGLIFGIDGCGYDFYEYHWIPLYKARGLHWHKEDEHVSASVSN